MNQVKFNRETTSLRRGNTHTRYVNDRYGMIVEQWGIGWVVYINGVHADAYGRLKDALEYARTFATLGRQAAEEFARSVMIRNGAKIAA